MEKQLLNKFLDQLDYMSDNKLKLSLLNEQLNSKSKPLDIKIVDFNNYMGAGMDREENKRNGIRESSPFLMNLPNVKVYIPSNPLEMLKNFKQGSGPKKAMEIDTMSTEITLAITTNLKLDLQDEESKSNLISKKKKSDKEVHFVTFQGFHPPFEVSMETIKNMQNLMVIEDWTITDFDNSLFGNPPI